MMLADQQQYLHVISGTQAAPMCMYDSSGYNTAASSTNSCSLIDGSILYDSSSPSKGSSSDGSTLDYCHSPVITPNPAMDMYSRMTYQLEKFWHEKVLVRKMAVMQAVEEVAMITHTILKEVECEEPRFSSSLTQSPNGRYEGLNVETLTEFNVLLYLNHMAVFSFVDEGCVPGCAVLKLSDGRKRSMSLWVEFITASGYLSARKIRSKFQSLVAQAIEKCHFSTVRLLPDASDVRIIIKETFVVHISPAFNWKGTWPLGVGNWPMVHQLAWPTPQQANDAMSEGVTLISEENVYMKDKQSSSSSSEGDAWLISFADAEDRLLYSYGNERRRVLSIIKCLRDRHLDSTCSIITNYHLKTLVLYESEKHPNDSEWNELCHSERISSLLLQLISCLQNRHCPHYLLPNVDLFRGLDRKAMDRVSKAAWGIVRAMLTSKYCFDNL